jgi:hypothetical protein
MQQLHQLVQVNITMPQKAPIATIKTVKALSHFFCIFDIMNVRIIKASLITQLISIILL